MYNDYRDVGGAQDAQVEKINELVADLKKYEEKLANSVSNLSSINKKLEGDNLKLIKKDVFEGRMAKDLAKVMEDIKKTMNDTVKKSNKCEEELRNLISELNKKATSLVTITK